MIKTLILKTIEEVEKKLVPLREAFKEQDTSAINMLCTVKQELIDTQDYEMLANFKELEDEYIFPVPYIARA